MKIPKKDGTSVPKGNDACDNWEDILCDKCRKSCRDSESMNFEYAAISVHWGFGSRKDGEHHEGEICENCYDALGISPTIKDYLFGDGAVCNCNLGSQPKVIQAKCDLHGTRSYGGDKQ